MIQNPIMKLILSILISLNTISVIYSQEADQLFVRLVKIEIEPDALAQYTELLNQQMNTAVKLEEGVLEYRVVNEKENTHRFTLIEIYRGYDSYLSHIKTPHFLKYKTALKIWLNYLN